MDVLLRMILRTAFRWVFMDTTVGMNRCSGVDTVLPHGVFGLLDFYFLYLTACDTPQLPPTNAVVPCGHCRRKCRLSIIFSIRPECTIPTLYSLNTDCTAALNSACFDASKQLLHGKLSSLVLFLHQPFSQPLRSDSIWPPPTLIWLLALSFGNDCMSAFAGLGMIASHVLHKA